MLVYAPRTANRQPDSFAAPMIDVVFLLLIYFILTASLDPPEAELGFTLPQVTQLAAPLPIPNDLTVAIDNHGQVSSNAYNYGLAEKDHLIAFETMVAQLQHAIAATQGELNVIVVPQAQTRHQYIVAVMDAVDRAGVTRMRLALPAALQASPPAW